LANVLGNRYEYHPEFAPTSDMLSGYKDKKITWGEYEKIYRELLQKRNPLQNCDISKLDRICFLRTEKSAIQCHRKLAAEYIASKFVNIEIVHL